jgi:hypothetical protein
MAIPTRRRGALATALALLLAVESVSAVAAAGVVATTRTQLAEPPAAAAPAVRATRTATAPAPASSVARRPSTTVHADAGRRPVAVTVAPAPSGGATADRTAPGPGQLAAPAIKRETSAPASAPSTSKGTGATISVAAYSGRNHVWIPALGMSRSVSSFACSRSREPDNYVYRWGCAGANNVYLLGHAWGVMKPLHDAYTSGRLKVGMKVWYADGNGRVRTYAVRWWKVVKPTTAASWAWAAQSTPSMTLQTCVGAQSQNRLMVRLTEAG